jgi:hypothetical protein
VVSGWFFVFRLIVDQRGVLDQPAELLLRDMVMRALASIEIFDGFIFHLEAFQMHDAKELVSRFPSLTLLKLHGGQVNSMSNESELQRSLTTR